MAKKTVNRTRMSDAEAEKFADHHEKTHDLKGKEATGFWRRYGARRLAALARDQKKHGKAPKAKAKPKAKAAQKKAA